MINFKPQKGKAYDKLPNKTLATFNETKYLVSTKYDGNQIFIAKHEGKIRWFTSDWKEFNIEGIGMDLLAATLHLEDYTIVAEFMYDSAGKLGDRRKSAILTTLRTNFSKGLRNTTLVEEKVNIKAFDYVSIATDSYTERLYRLERLIDICPYQLDMISTMLLTGSEAIDRARRLVGAGWEGIMAVEPDTLYQIGKRVNHSIKLKYRKTADLLCIGTTDGEGKYEGMIGSLILKDSKGREVSVGSGLDDSDRLADPIKYIGKIIEIEYEQLMDTYIQPTYIRVRDDKKESD